MEGRTDGWIDRTDIMLQQQKYRKTTQTKTTLNVYSFAYEMTRQGNKRMDGQKNDNKNNDEDDNAVVVAISNVKSIRRKKQHS